MDDFLYPIADKADSDMVLPLPPPCWPISREREEDKLLKSAGLLPGSGSAPVGVDGRDDDRENGDRIDDRMLPDDRRRPLLDGRRNTGMEILWTVPVLADLTSMALRSTISAPFVVSSCFILAKYLSSPEGAFFLLLLLESSPLSVRVPALPLSPSPESAGFR